MFNFTPTLYHSPFSLAESLFDMHDAYKTKSRHATDVTDEGDSYLIAIELPGYKKEEIEVSLETKYLTITAKPEKAEGEVEKKYLSRERVHGEFSRTYTVQNVDESGIRVAYESGVLMITLPKKKPIEPETHRFTVQ